MLTGAILAGGSSSRMGQEKGLMLLHGAPFVRRVAEVLSGLCDEVVVSVAPGKKDDYTSALAMPARVVEDRTRGLGPLEGLVSAFAAASGDLVVVSPCDTPFLRKRICKMVVDSAEGRDGAVPVVGGHFEPLHGVYSRTKSLQAFRRTQEEGFRKPKDAYRYLDLANVEEERLRRVDPELLSFFNINTADDLRKAEETLLRTPLNDSARSP